MASFHVFFFEADHDLTEALVNPTFATGNVLEPPKPLHLSDVLGGAVVKRL